MRAFPRTTERRRYHVARVCSYIHCRRCGYTAVPADCDGDGRTDFVVYNTATGQWYGLRSGSGYTATINVSWGGSGDIPVKGDFDGDNRADLATYVENTDTWYILLSGANYTTTIVRRCGGSGYAALPAYP
jgi:hypothetical protein